MTVNRVMGISLARRTLRRCSPLTLPVDQFLGDCVVLVERGGRVVLLYLLDGEEEGVEVLVLDVKDPRTQPARLAGVEAA
jgi:hypothetical protein